MDRIFTAIAVLLMIIGCAEEKKPISAFEFSILADDCKAKGGAPG